MTREVRQHPLLHQAAAIAHRFSLDPAAVLAERDELRVAVRIAATQHIIDAEQAAAEKAKQRRR